MALLDILTPEAIAERFFTLPEELQNALEDKDNQRTIQMACVLNGVGDPEELKNVEAIVAAVFLGFTHMDDLKETLAENLSLDPQTSGKMADEFRNKVLEPFRKSIEKIYAPIGGPKKAPDVVPPMAVKMPPSVPVPTPALSPTSATTPPPMPLRPAPANLPLGAPPPAPIQTPGKTAEEPKGWQATKLTVPVPVAGTPPMAGPAPAPAPFMMHEESSASPLATGPEFRLNISKDIFKSATVKPIDIPRPPKAAQLEIGRAPLPPRPQGSVSFRTTPVAQSRVVHYTDLRTSLSPGPAVPPAARKPLVAETPITKTPVPLKPPLTAPPIKTASTAPKVVNFGPEEVK